MSINLGQLYDAVLGALNRKNDTAAKGLLETWRALAESDIFNVLRAGWMTRRGDAIFTNQVETLPPSVIQIVGMMFLQSNVPDTSVARVLVTDNTQLGIAPNQYAFDP
jgi:hypothetical protein